MGGCRCTYRNCSVKSDGSTHLFHYPVFDKFRCHKWLTNAQRLDFLNLKVSQLKNRVVCQHHFKDEMFMNFKKDKLNCIAIPTENGPFCGESDTSRRSNTSNKALYPINVEHIENELINANGDKKAKFSVKYGDFLANCDLMELSNRELESDNIQVETPKKPNGRMRVVCREPVFKIHYDNELEFTDKKYFIGCDFNEEVLNKKLGGDAIHGDQKVMRTSEAATIAYYENNATGTTNTALSEPAIKPQFDDDIKLNQPNNSKKKSGANIIAQESFCPPLTEVPTLIPISPNSLLEVPPRVKIERSKSSNNNDNSIMYHLKPQENVQAEHLHVQAEHFHVQAEHLHERPAAVSPSKDNSILSKQNQPLPQQKPLQNRNVASPILPKSKGISNERTATIQEKRNFNKKLRDIITDSLNLLDENDFRTKNDNVNESIPEHPDKMNKQLINFLDARMNRMENKLLQQIESNSKEISELKNAMLTSKTSDVDEEVHKKNLFRDISIYLSADAKSLIFEELFINKHVQPKVTPEITRRSSKRRKL